MRFSIITVLFLLAVNVFPQTKEDLNIFQRNAINYDSDYFNINDEFVIMGNMELNGKNIVLANNVHYWGVSTQRATWRLLLFLNDGTFLGIYTGITYNTNEIKIEGQRVYFPFESKTGNVIDFSKGIPNEIWINGYIITYTKINDL
jgi:hypothetical protein